MASENPFKKKKNTFLWEKQSSIYEWIMCRYTVYSVYCKGFPIISIMRFDYKKVFCRIGVKVRWCVLMENIWKPNSWLTPPHHVQFQTVHGSAVISRGTWTARLTKVISNGITKLRAEAVGFTQNDAVGLMEIIGKWMKMDQNGWTSMTSREPADVLKLARGFRPLFASVEATGDRFVFKENVWTNLVC